MMLPLVGKQTKFCDPFNAKYAEQTYRSRDNILGEMNKALNINDNKNMAKKTIMITALYVQNSLKPLRSLYEDNYT